MSCKLENLVFLVWVPDHETSWLEFTTTPPEDTEINLETDEWRYRGELPEDEVDIPRRFPIGQKGHHYRNLDTIPKGRRRGTIAVFDRTNNEHLEALHMVSMYIGMSTGRKQALPLAETPRRQSRGRR